MSEAQDDKRTLLIEIGTEELPPKLVMNDVIAFVSELGFRLEHEKFLASAPSDIPPLQGLRRIAVKVKDVAAQQPQETVERKGPSAAKIDAGDAAVQGFAKSCGVGVSELTLRDGRLFCHAKTGGKSLAEVLSKLLPALLNQIRISRPMRWGAGEHAFARPVRWLCVLHGDKVIDCELFGVKSGRLTYGHRHHCPEPLELESADGYEEDLRDKGHVIVNFAERGEQIEDALQEKGHAVAAGETHSLLEEVTASTEWPQALDASFDKAFLALPPEVITQTLEHALKVFTKQDEKGRLLPEFTIIADVESKNPKTIIHGYENVARARLEDAKFFFEQDRKTSLEDRRPMLERTLFQEKLGTLADKAKRLETLADFLAPLCGASPEHTRRAAQLCKCDLGTGLVGEYPGLQGIMGGYYAAADGEDEKVAAAIREHYLPRGRDDMPASAGGAALALADKVDTLVGFWSINLKPSGSKDPYGLRRAANGILRILIKRGIDLEVKELIDKAAARYKAGDDLKKDLHSYMVEQLCSYDFVQSFSRHAGTGFDRVKAVTEIVMNMENLRPSDFFSRLDAVASFIKDPAADSLIAANKRIWNILKKASGDIPDKPDQDAMTEDAERDLFKAVEDRRKKFDRQFEKRDYLDAMKTLAELREPIDCFFDKVMVMSDNESERNNRLALLTDIRSLFLKIADFSELNPNKPEPKK